MTALTKVDIARYLVNEFAKDQAPDAYHLDPKIAKEFVELYFEEMRQLLSQGHSIRLSGFGKFILRDKSSRPGRNPKTGELIPVKERRVVTFHPGQKLKAQVDKLGAKEE